MKCTLCPRNCGVDRKEKTGFCSAPDCIRVARASKHMWEEPPISGKSGSGTIFFSHCNLKCVYCQNYKISAEGFGKDITVEDLSHIMLSLQNDGAANINLVSPTPYTHLISEAVRSCKDELKIPIIWNTGGYEKAQTIRDLNGIVDVFLTDMKYISSDLASEYSNAKDYPIHAVSALHAMLETVGKEEYSPDGMIRKGVIVRHLVLPSHRDESIKVLELLKNKFGTEDYSLSLMRQYYPCYMAEKYPKINRTVTSYEFQKVSEYAEKLGFHGFYQEKGSEKESYTPAFDLSGIV